LYSFCSDQYLVGSGGAFAINFLAVDKGMDYFEIGQEERVEFYEKVRFLASKVISLQQEEQEANRKASQK